jgi:hypothetical protein
VDRDLAASGGEPAGGQQRLSCAAWARPRDREQHPSVDGDRSLLTITGDS